MIDRVFPLWVSITSLILAQILKPLVHYCKTKEWDIDKILESGGFPSSHSALVTSLTISVGIQERFSSTLFAVTAAFSIIVLYDAANVRYYSGQNIKITQQLIKDLQKFENLDLSSPIYKTKVKEVLGHKWIEVAGGVILGALIVLVMYYIYILRRF